MGLDEPLDRVPCHVTIMRYSRLGVKGFAISPGLVYHAAVNRRRQNDVQVRIM